MQVYKLLHKPTGLFYTPSRGYGNLSTSGKIYGRKPSLNQISGVRIIIRVSSDSKLTKKNQALVDHFKITLEKNRYYQSQYFSVPDSDWEIVEI